MNKTAVLAIGTAFCLLPLVVAAQQTPDAAGTAAKPDEARGRPANICHELVAFLQPKPAPQSATPQAAAPQAATPQAVGQPQPAQAAGQPAQPPQASAQSGSAQQASGQGGVGPEAPKPNAPAQQASGPNAPQTSGQSAPVPPQGSGQNAPQTSGQSAPIPQGSTQSTPAQTAVTFEQAQALAEANDIKACRDATQKMRRAGVALPPALIALAALDPQRLEAAPQQR